MGSASASSNGEAAASEQTAADRQRRITESFSKAAEQLANEKIEVRLGGIYTLERISRESADDYWTVMETLTAFVRERARSKEPEQAVMESMARFHEIAEKERSSQSKPVPPTDIAAVLTVINRRKLKEREREKKMLEGFDLRSTDLRGAKLMGAHLEGANLMGAHLEGADLQHASFENAYLVGAHLEGALLGYIHLQGASLVGAHLEGVFLLGARLERAILAETTGLTEEQLSLAHGDTATVLPAAMSRPTHWRYRHGRYFPSAGPHRGRR